MKPNLIARDFVLLLVAAGASADAFRPSGRGILRERIRSGSSRPRESFPRALRTDPRGLEGRPRARCFRSYPAEQPPATSLPMNAKTNANENENRNEWDGDDIRWTSRARRNFARRRLMADKAVATSPAKTGLIALLALLYGYQILATILSCYRKFPSHWRDHALEIVLDSFWGSAMAGGPLAATFGFSAALSRARHSHRYLTSGFVHNGLPHLLVDLVVLAKQPSWLAAGLGAPLYLTCFWGSTVAGNLAHLLNTSDRRFDPRLCLGSNGGICGLYGLMFVCLTRMASANPGRTRGRGGDSGNLFRGLAVMAALTAGTEHVSAAANVGGFLGGAAIGAVFGPRYGRSYAMRRKNSVGYDPASRSYRSAMGFGIAPRESGRVPLRVLYGVLLMLAVAVPTVRNVPLRIAEGLVGALR